MRYKPNLKYNYPDKPDEHMITVPHIVDTNFDENYPYYDKSKWFKIKRFFFWILLNVLVFPVVKVRYGLKIKGRKILRKNKKLLKNGAVTICNHVLMWDYLCVLVAIRPRLEHILAWPVNLEGPNRKYIRMVGGMPIPTNKKAMKVFNEHVKEVLNDKKWLHVFPETAMWYYYPTIRPFKKGAFTIAYKHNVPIIPLAISYRKPSGIYKLLGIKKPQLTITIGEPEFADIEKPKKLAVEELRNRCHIKMQNLAGITKDDPDYWEMSNEEKE